MQRTTALAAASLATALLLGAIAIDGPSAEEPARARPVAVARPAAPPATPDVRVASFQRRPSVSYPRYGDTMSLPR